MSLAALDAEERVVGWFAEGSDLILVMFDTSKVDISDEMKQVVQQLREVSATEKCSSRYLPSVGCD